ncbi:MAG: hypothetical protein ACT4PZ_21425 [Panacagrimonas sp.]
MLGLTPLGLIHTPISLVAVAAGFYALAKYREIALRSGAGKLYILMTVLTCLTGFPIFQHGGFGAPHALGVLTLIVLAVAMSLEWRGGGLLTTSTYTLLYSLTLFFHMIPAFTETGTRLPAGNPVFSGPEDPNLQALVGAAFLVYLVGAALQVRRLRNERQSSFQTLRSFN